ncbi:BZ3500_MvSof-1268-A1-R1_Chr2-2g05150 [Microbotryum saponariae]|uniref:BZ3500_MvSof-1268-A1-R1_Chr2-2g05150 protein n=1 Tax=Microbotryum saponariae TaxID=289078 RepID=A0A2X0M7R3_9BASI|nr:BZ3500_MvSof-1268-A1-R1_Chr2-2g05150 [Microbotryum saponariae]SDA00977.1 BZ3501_MvSof-1269-A2-R1_Chr2-2g04824 [Microbotryum saponariae]
MEWAPQFPAEMLAQHRAYLQPMLWAFLIGSLLTGLIFALCTHDRGLDRRQLDGSRAWARMAPRYKYFVQHGGDPIYTLAFHAEDYAWTIICALCNITGQIWFVERAWRSSQSWLFLGAAVVCMLGEFATALGVAVMGFRYGNDPTKWVMIGQLSIALALLTVALDLLTSVVLIVRIKRLMRTVDGARNRPFEALVRLACATGSLTAIVAIIDAVLYITVWTNSNAWLPFIEALPRISFLSCLITINSRERWRTVLGLTPDPSSNPSSREPRPPARLCVKTIRAKLDTSAFERLTQASCGRKDWPTTMVNEGKIGSCDDLEKAVSDQEQPNYESPFDKQSQSLPKTGPVQKLPRTISLASLRRASSNSIARHPTSATVQHVMVEVNREIVIE